MEQVEKLRVLLHHWVEHNESHKAEFDKWAGRAREMDEQDAAERLLEASRHLEAASEALKQAASALS